MVKNGIMKNCLTCNKPFYVPQWNKDKAKYCSRYCKLHKVVQFCPLGHDTFITGREEGGQCSVCRKEYTKIYNETHKEERKVHYEATKDERKEARRKYYLEHRDEILAAAKAYREEHKDEINAKLKPYHREYNLKYAYGITPADYDRMFEEQKGLCLGCNLKKELVIDHDHSTGKVRGLLCDGCNRGIGYLQEDIETFKRLITYLEKNKSNDELLQALKALSSPL